MKITISQINPKTLGFEYNYKLIQEKLKESDVDSLVVFPELSLSGSPLYDSASYRQTHQDSIKYADKLTELKKDFIFGLPIHENGETFNALAFVENGELKALSTKKNLGRFDKGFTSGEGFTSIEYKKQTIAFGFLEDLDEYLKKEDKSDLIICSSNVLFTPEAQKDLLTSLQPKIRKAHKPIILVNRCGAEGSYIFNGSSFFMLANGDLSKQLSLFEEESLQIDSTKADKYTQSPLSRIEKLYHAAILGIRDYFHKNNIKKALLGLSGGIDSALVVVLAVEALGKDNVIGILLPSEYSTSHSITDAKASAEKLGIEHYVIPIKESFDTALTALQPIFEGKEPNVAEENLQSRIRGLIIMGIANKIGAAVLNTTNKSELAVGYGTLYGDTNGAIGTLGDIYKTDVWEMSRWINRNEEIIPWNSINKAPSAELRPDQKDTDSLPDYDLLDKTLYLHLEERKSREEIINEGIDPQIVDKILRLVKINEWKRNQVAPALRMSNSALSIDRIMPIS